MRLFKSSFFLAFYVVGTLTLDRSALAEEIYGFDRAVVGLADQRSPGSALFISSDGRADWFQGGKFKRSQSYSVVHPECLPKSQSTSSGGLTLAYPFLVGTSTACIIDESSRSIRLLASFGWRSNSFSATYAGEGPTTFNFLINGRPWDTEGYLGLVTIDKTTLVVKSRELMSDVPGYSGAMVFEGGNVWVTVWAGDNLIYKISGAKLGELAQSGAKASFASVMTQAHAGIEGLSLFMLASEDSFFYYNGEYESYLIEKGSGRQKKIVQDCEPIVSYGKQWLVLCGGLGLEARAY